MQNAELKRLSGMLGLSMRAGRLIVGTELVCLAMPKHKVMLTVISRAASDSTKKKLTVKSAFYNIDSIVIDLDTEELASVIGKSSSVAAVGITDENFAEQIKKLASKT